MQYTQTGTDKPRIDRIIIHHELDGEWNMVGIYAVAEVSYPSGNGSRRVERLQSGGLWGIESGAEDYFEEVEQEQLGDLKAHLERFNVDTSNWDDRVAAATRKE